MKKIFLSLFIMTVILLTGCSSGGNSAMSGTTWIGKDGSEVVFSDSRITWYQSPDEHNDNYYAGEYKYLRGSEAVKYITTELAEYDVTEEELKSLFERNNNYDESNFVVFDIRYDKFILSGAEQEIPRSLVPWYGFIINNETYLDVVNMNNASYYGFTKQQ